MKIIYIDDDATNRAVMKEMLAPAGLALAEAPDARSGLRMIELGSYDLVIMDLRMPEVSGLTAIRQLRAREGAGPHVPVLMISAELSPGVREMCRHAGADGFVEKPISMDRLFAEVGAVAAAHQGLMLS